MTICTTVNWNGLKVVVEANMSEIKGREYDSGIYAEDVTATAIIVDQDDEEPVPTLDELNGDNTFEQVASRALADEWGGPQEEIW